MPSKKPASHNISRRITKLLSWIVLLPVLSGCGALPAGTVPTNTSPAPATITSTATAFPTQTQTVKPIPTQKPFVCGRSSAMFILLVGSDSRQDTYNIGLSDSMRVIRVDFVEPRVQVMTFPRDLYVEIPEIEDHYGITHGKLNQAYLYGNPGYGYYDGPGHGPGLLSLTLEQNFGSRVDRYAAVNIQTFVRIIDDLGGIDIDLPYEIDGRVKRSRDPNRYFPPGKQHLDGYRTMLLARMRPDGDFERMEIQNLILQAVAEELLSPSSISKLPELIRSFKKSVQTDLGPVEIAQLLCLRAKLDPQNIAYGNFPENLFKLGRVNDPVLGNTSILRVDFNVLRAYVDRFNQGDWPKLQEDPKGILDP
jgi:LCP family protein required for cell wall assembly